MGFFSSLNFLDVQLFWVINSAHTPFFDQFFAAFTNLGSGWVAVPIVAAIVLFKVRRVSLIHTLIFIAVSMSLAGISNSWIKTLVSRPRPLTYFAAQRQQAIEKGTDMPEGPGREALVPRVVGPRWKHRSFPSGHANTACSAAMILCTLFGGVWALAFAPAVLVGYSRVYLGVHFPLDSFGGGMLGAIVIALVFSAYRRWVFDFTRTEDGGGIR